MSFSKVKIRKILISVHLYTAAFITPFLLIMGVSGALYVSGNNGTATKTELAIIDNFPVDPKNNPNMEADVRALLARLDIDLPVDYVRGRKGFLQTRPTHKPFITIAEEGGTATVTLNEPDFFYSLMELHKGHGPRIFRSFETIVGIGLILIVLGGVIVGLLAPGYKKPTIVMTLLGFCACIGLAL